MSKKKIMRSFKLNEISAVDMPAQEGATAAVIKRAVSKRLPIGSVEKVGGVLTSEVNGHAHAVMVAESENVAEEKRAEYQETSEETDTMSAEIEKMKRVMTLSGEQFDFFKGLSVEDQESFLAANVSGRDQIMKSAKDADPIAWTDEETGTEYRKSDGARMIEMAKSAATMRKALRDALAKTEAVELAKRAVPVAGNLPGGESVAVALVGAIEKIADEKVRGECLAAIKAGNEAMTMAFKRVGTSAASSIEGSAEARYAKAIDKIAAERNISKISAEVEFLNSPAGAQLYAEIDQENVAKRLAAKAK